MEITIEEIKEYCADLYETPKWDIEIFEHPDDLPPVATAAWQVDPYNDDVGFIELLHTPSGLRPSLTVNGETAALMHLADH